MAAEELPDDRPGSRSSRTLAAPPAIAEEEGEEDEAQEAPAAAEEASAPPEPSAANAEPAVEAGDTAPAAAAAPAAEPAAEVPASELQTSAEARTADGAAAESDAPVDSGGPIPQDLGAADRATLEITEKRIQRILKENTQLCEQLSGLSAELAQVRASEEELQVTWRTAANVSARQKVVAQNLTKNAQYAVRSELQRATEAAQQVCDLKEVHSQLLSVNRQLSFAVELQAQGLDECDYKITSRARRIRKLELAVYRVVAHAQRDPRLQETVAGLVAKCGPLIHGVLSREAQRQALELTAEEDG
eukprot:gnl/TRDRNA2_/TRDRNA2_57118_c0_seq1.p1 gnl/TRDRNA2_/TRDRNA2_57118_c0~~gnl/TRDRNA2_/TRDRNA2_57118_c0_seq1.p1  ORF type:complete len:304 (+),score=91.54 gnl/TRDRNA2_/TRDRNA2_57118_c0_seq1:51-962(+)